VRNEGIIMTIMAIFFTIVTPIYWLTSYEPAGTAALALTAAMSALIAFYILFTARRLPGPRPEDRTDADVEEGAGDLGFYSPHSWWPLFLALSAAVAALGLVFGWWLVGLGMILVLLTLGGLLFEYYRGPAASQYR
jgi:Cytochrome c oxidase subunit IV